MTIALRCRFRLRRSGDLYLAEHVTPNLEANVGLDDMLDVYFSGGTQKALWYIGLISQTGFSSSVAAGDTMASHAGWLEGTNYSEATRVQWIDGGVSSRFITNPAAAQFTMTTADAVVGAFLVSNNTKSGTTGILFSAAEFGDPITPTVGEILRLYWDGTIAQG